MYKSMENMAKDKILVYMYPLVYNKEILFEGHNLKIATKKAVSAWPSFADYITKVSTNYEKELLNLVEKRKKLFEKEIV